MIEPGSFGSAGVISEILAAKLTSKIRVTKLIFEVIGARKKGSNVRQKLATWSKVFCTLRLIGLGSEIETYNPVAEEEAATEITIVGL